jgi:hypothetical protein
MWTIETQIEKHGRNEVPVLCKHVKFFPIEQGGRVVDFGRLKPLVFSVIVNFGKTSLKMTMSISKGEFTFPQFTIHHPDTMGLPEIWVGQGKTRRKIKDMLSPEVKIPGLKEKYPYKFDFERRLKQIGGDALHAEVMKLFAERVAPFESKSKAA